MEFSNRRLAYITSMAKGGLSGFNFRELLEMHKLGVKLFLFVTKYIEGPYMAPDGVPTFPVKPIEAILLQPLFFLKRPFLYFHLFFVALTTRTIADFFIAQCWSVDMKKNGANWIHCHWGDRKLYIGFYCSKLINVPLSVTLHGYDLYDNPNWKMFQYSLQHCAKIITISNYNKNLLTKKFSLPGNRIDVIRLSADLVQDPDKIKRDTKVLIVAGFEYRKGYDTLMQAFRIIDRDDISLWVVGYPAKVDVHQLSIDFGVEDRVVIFGQISDEVLKLLYTYCDIFVMPSRFSETGVGEGLPVALMEAMSYKKPIVSTYHTGIPELVPDILVEENDAQGLAEGIQKLADDPQLRERMGIRNREIVKEDFSNENVKNLLDSFG